MSSADLAAVSARLDEIRAHAFKLYRDDHAEEEARRSRTFSVLDNKAETAAKQKLYKQYDAIYDTIWLRFVYISGSRFDSGDSSRAVHSNLVRVTGVSLEVRQALFDLLDLLVRIKFSTGGSSSSVHSPEFATRALSRLYPLAWMQERLTELASEVKIKLAGKTLDVGPGISSGRGLRSLSVMHPPPPAAPPVRLTPAIEAPIVLLDERLKHATAADRELLYSLAPDLRDLRTSLGILAQLGCDDSAALLALADSLGDAYFAVWQRGGAVRDELAPAVLAAFHSARANAWMELRVAHGLDLATTTIASGAAASGAKQQRQVQPAPASPSNASAASSSTSASASPPPPPPARATNVPAAAVSSLEPPPSLVASASGGDGNGVSPRLSPSSAEPQAAYAASPLSSSGYSAESALSPSYNHSSQSPPPPPLLSASLASNSNSSGGTSSFDAPPALLSSLRGGSADASADASAAASYATAGRCAFVNCGNARFAGRPYCVGHLSMGE